MAKEELTLIQKLAKIRAISDVVVRDKKGYNYTYADITSILANITAGMKKYNVSLIPLIVPETAKVSQNYHTTQKISKTGTTYESTSKEMLVEADMVFRWINDDNPEDFIDVSWFVVGSQSDPSQAFGSGLTYCTRYFLTSYFQIAQPELDTDVYRTKQKEAEDLEDKMITQGIIEEIDLEIKKYLSDNPDKAEEVKKFVRKYDKKADYFNIKEPVLASKLLEDFRETKAKWAKASTTQKKPVAKPKETKGDK